MAVIFAGFRKTTRSKNLKAAQDLRAASLLLLSLVVVLVDTFLAEREAEERDRGREEG